MGKKGKMLDMNLPIWFDGQNINEALFCEEFLQERRIIFANGAFFTPDGRVTDDLPLRGEIYEKLKFCAVNNIPRKITNILEVLKLEAQVPDFPPEQDRIHVSNGTLLLNGTFTEGRPAIVRRKHSSDLGFTLATVALNDHHALTFVGGNQTVADKLLQSGDVLRMKQSIQKVQPGHRRRSIGIVDNRQTASHDSRSALGKCAVQ